MITLANTAPRSVLDMPAEIRNMIYSFCLTCSNHESPVDRRSSRSPRINFSLTCCRIRAETMQMYLRVCQQYWNTTQFVIDMTDHQEPARDNAAVMVLEPQPYFNNIQRLRLLARRSNARDSLHATSEMTAELGVWRVTKKWSDPVMHRYDAHAVVWHKMQLQDRGRGSPTRMEFRGSIEKARERLERLSKFGASRVCTRYEHIMSVLGYVARFQGFPLLLLED
ncbi:hypothetical protein DOTSEDRAFT_74957 [Dothistroma septosporum NZE10]|uniref:F-box domain-containing protein n=1 Tax=Dothistroma septosporum (strain NZE10 / CBS 128990) TaxID=675120 RepID=N1PG93_DOTSN|nr:hypothetical protein DOTSEDRAFT_74957 [Dothistroma septosporum NZE10]